MLAAPLALGAAACSGTGRGRGGAPDRDAQAVQDARARELSLLAAYDAAIAGLPGDPVLAGVRAEHLAHLQALGGREPTGGATPTASVSAPPPQVRDTLMAAERGAATAGQAAAVNARSPATAQLLASIAASEASHPATLGAVGAVR